MNAKIFSNVKFLLAISIGAIIASAFVILQEDEVENSVYEGPLKAVIIDQLYDDIPNDEFHQTAKEYLETAGYEVDIFTTKQVTVDFYKNLPQMNYKFVVIRTHGVAEQTNEETVGLFTGEKYTEDLYISEQLFGQVRRGIPVYTVNFQVGDHDSSDWVEVNGTYTLTTAANILESYDEEFFVITPKLVDEQMKGTFSGTVFLLGGCSTLANPSMASSLVKRGASSVMGWSDTVGNYSNDFHMLNVLKMNLLEDVELEKAIELTEQRYPVDTRQFSGILKYYSEPSV